MKLIPHLWSQCKPCLMSVSVLVLVFHWWELNFWSSKFYASPFFFKSGTTFQYFYLGRGCLNFGGEDLPRCDRGYQLHETPQAGCPIVEETNLPSWKEKMNFHSTACFDNDMVHSILWVYFFTFLSILLYLYLIFQYSCFDGVVQFGLALSC